MKDNIKVKQDDIENMKIKYDLEYFETSAKDGTNVQKVFEYLAKIVLKSRGYLKDEDINEINVIEKEEQKIEVKKVKKVKKKNKSIC